MSRSEIRLVAHHLASRANLTSRRLDLSKTRMYSSRMHTTRFNGGIYGGGMSLPKGCLPRGCLSRDEHPLDPKADIHCPIAMLGYTPPAHCILGSTNPFLKRMTDRCRNITLPQTSIAGGNYLRLNQTSVNFSKF